MNNIIEFFIKAVDMTSGAVRSAGASLNSLRKAAPAINLINQSLGDMPGFVGKAIKSISGLAGAFAAGGPLMFAITGVMTAIRLVGDYFKDKADEMVAKAEEASARIREKLARIREDALKAVADQIGAVAKRADRAASAFDRMATSAQKLASIRNARAAAGEDATLAQLRDDMTRSVGNAKDEDKARFAAAWRVKLAEEEAKIAEARAKREDEAEAAALRTAEKRVKMLQANIRNLERVALRLQTQAKDARERLGSKDEYAAGLTASSARMDERLQREHQALDAAKEALAIARGQASANQINRQNHVASARTAARSAWFDYDKAEADYAAALAAAQDKADEARQKAIEDEKRQRLDVERAIAQKRADLLKAEIADYQTQMAAAQSRLAQAQAKSVQAWGWYRNQDSLAAQIEEEKANAAAEKQYAKDFERLRSHHRDWRTAENLSLNDEAVRRVALAREEQGAAEEHLAAIEANTADLARKLDELLEVK